MKEQRERVKTRTMIDATSRECPASSQIKSFSGFTFASSNLIADMQLLIKHNGEYANVAQIRFIEGQTLWK